MYLEIVQMGNVCRCSAIDARTNIEVSIVAPATYSRYTMEQNAIRKLRRVLEQREQGGGGSGGTVA
ncbi:hypothetical protein C882_3973 [Caenispirillum salinarum AK4]|uniref:DUF6898 domain-containing protein n=1 Tax=Caenispirillum salinarum AK4 TaxID=1238182 RepID=K9H074_9PROT|nr:hypothetical protein [Caenispirillum salinarum]EKV31600.1 hypothetical protein C882_3973 [Caenispirillum salinarum AK4]